MVVMAKILLPLISLISEGINEYKNIKRKWNLIAHWSEWSLNDVVNNDIFNKKTKSV